MPAVRRPVAGPQRRAGPEAGALFALIGRRGPTVLLADDAGDQPAGVLALGAAVRPGVLVVAATEPDAPAAGRLDALADVVVDLPPLPAPAVRELLGRRYRTPSTTRSPRRWVTRSARWPGIRRPSWRPSTRYAGTAGSPRPVGTCACATRPRRSSCRRVIR
ncbi:hypothetical protein [Micromonospora sp. CA-246542]|uniref:hypothetical protein n=1 Tax=Micromonospora sp. CA-246542 TaxID=3239959 RepID=UPI003D9216FF